MGSHSRSSSRQREGLFARSQQFVSVWPAVYDPRPMVPILHALLVVELIEFFRWTFRGVWLCLRCCINRAERRSRSGPPFTQPPLRLPQRPLFPLFKLPISLFYEQRRISGSWAVFGSLGLQTRPYSSNLALMGDDESKVGVDRTTKKIHGQTLYNRWMGNIRLCGLESLRYGRDSSRDDLVEGEAFRRFLLCGASVLEFRGLA